MSADTAERPDLDVAHLRQYLRAMKVDGDWAEEWLRLTLEKIPPSTLAGEPSSPERRLALFGAFYKVWRDNAENPPESAPPLFTDEHLMTFIGDMPPASQQMLLLADLLGFSVEDAGNLLGVGRKQADALLAEGRRLTDSLTPAQILILEDQGLIAEELAETVESLGLQVSGIARDRRDAIEIFEASSPDIVLSDQMLANDDKGIEVIRELLEKREFPAIFITAFPEDVLQGEEGEPTFIIAKPFNPAAVRAAISYALANDNAGSRKTG